MIIPGILGFIAVLLSIFLLIADKNKDLSSKVIKAITKLHIGEVPAERLYTTAKGFLLILCLVIIFATLVYYFG